jgi:hypothetical protein
MAGVVVMVDSIRLEEVNRGIMTHVVHMWCKPGTETQK